MTIKCRFCGNNLKNEFIDLVNSPPSNSFLSEEQLNEPEIFYPLKLFVCDKCFLVQIDEYKKSDEIFNSDYAYFSSFSQSWLEHSKKYVEMIVKRLGLNESSLVAEIASNDGYLLQYFKQMGIQCYGIEPTINTSLVSKQKGIDVVEKFFDASLATHLAAEGKRVDLLLGNNVLAHVPNINDFVIGLKKLIKDNGTITMEFPHILNLIEQNQFDTIYHEHFSYFSFYTVNKIFKKHGLNIFDVEELSTHGGSLRIYATHEEFNILASDSVKLLLKKEEKFGITNITTYSSFSEKVEKVKNNLLEFLISAKKEGKMVVGYGAAAKGNTLLNYCGIKKDLISFVVDKSPYKQGKFLPASHIPVLNEGFLKKEKPDYILIIPWNIKSEIIKQLSYIRRWGGKFVLAIPYLEIL
ncbi:MAG: methyltransferase domain-containing protein [Candidatus Acididesulfobacter guangdongensis]|uniref:Methyltransferase domain-containing protein n=1 Tax=Acididesulfobacter guangdongensis TaxID=2597225 RepID=A0A519BFF5_ACIG2|nr:MAG: methyltransferase domain-containing protein [Candidatus Acididesulfobacter guangdongensis]